MRTEWTSTGASPSGSSTLLTSAPTRLPDPAPRMTIAAGMGGTLANPRAGSFSWLLHDETGGQHAPPTVEGMEAGRDPRKDGWQAVCPADDLEFERGVAALVHGQAVALFRTPGGEIYALGNHDPFSRASTLARGIVGRRSGVPFVGSPVHRHAFDLRTGQCLDDEHVSVPAFEVKVVDGTVYVGGRRRAVA